MSRFEKNKKPVALGSIGGTELEKEVSGYINRWYEGIDIANREAKKKYPPKYERRTHVMDDYVLEVGESLVSNRKIPAVTFASWMINTKIYERDDKVDVYCWSPYFKQEAEARIGRALESYFLKPIKYFIDRNLEPKIIC